MLKKARADLSGKDAGDSKDMSQAVLDSSRHIWLAGLGAFSRAQAEGMKVFETLVKQGQALESRTRRAAVDTATAARGAAEAKVKEVKQGVGGTWDKLEQVFEARVARALSKLGVHTHSDVERLRRRLRRQRSPRVALPEWPKPPRPRKPGRPRRNSGALVRARAAPHQRKARRIAAGFFMQAQRAAGAALTRG